MLESFERRDVQVNGTRIHVAVGGNGPPVLLLHGYPQSHVMWHRFAPRLADQHTVVLADLRGYGDSSRPASLPDHASYSKRAMATDQVELMRQLGLETFALVGHDRGARVATGSAWTTPRPSPESQSSTSSPPGMCSPTSIAQWHRPTTTGSSSLSPQTCPNT